MSSQFIGSVECALQDHTGKFLIIQRPQNVHAAGLLAFPGGGVEYYDGTQDNDLLITAAKREVFEEVGLILEDPVEYLTSRYFLDHKQRPIMHTIFYCQLNKTKLALNISAREVPEYHWLCYQEIIDMPNCPPWLKTYLELIHTKFTRLNK